MTPDGADRTDYVTQRELFDALRVVTEEERTSRHDLANRTTSAITALDDHLDTRMRALETLTATLNTTIQLRPDPEPRLRALEAWRNEQRGAIAALRVIVAFSSITSTVVGVVELLRIVHP